MSRRSLILLVIAGLNILTTQLCLAGSAIWAEKPVGSDWNSATNWVPQTVPNGPGDTAAFAASNITSVATSAITEVNSIIFDPDAPPFNITTSVGTSLTISGMGIINNSQTVQTFDLKVTDETGSALFFRNDATAGESTVFNNPGSYVSFHDNSSASKATFITSKPGRPQGFLEFWDNATAADATIATDGNAFTIFFDDSTADNAVFTTSEGGAIFFSSNSSAGQASIQCSGGSQPSVVNGGVQFDTGATAAESHIVVNGAAVAGALANNIIVADSADGGSATFVVNGGPVPGANGATMNFYEDSSGEAANITINGGSNGGKGARLLFFDHADGGQASINLFGDGQMDIGSRAAPGVTVGSLAGDGLVFLGAKTLTVGLNNQSTSFAGVIQDGGRSHGTGGSLTKTGSGTITLSGANLYTGTTSVTAGTLEVANETGSATGVGTVKVNSGTLGGSGLIAGATTIGTGSGGAAFLAPALGTKTPATLTIQSALTLNSDATYTCTFKAKRNKARIDLVVANGVTINGASLNLSGQTQGSLKRGLRLTLISNTSANPISGTFANLPEGGIVTINGNNLQASYSGGDGNDLTLTVVP